jgi:thymidylate synthase
MNNYEIDYRKLLERILRFGERQDTRTGPALCVFDWSLKINLQEGFPLLTGKQTSFKVMHEEFKWMKRGDTNVHKLQEAGVNIWNQWADAKGDLGPTYGKQIHAQWAATIGALIANPYGRRHVISLWQFADLPRMVLPPCYTEMQFYVDCGDRLNMRVSFRSSDAAVGLPYDVGTLTLFLLAAVDETGHRYHPGKLVLHLTNAHVNEENVDAVKHYLSTPISALPALYADKELLAAFANTGYKIKMTVKP